MQWKSEVVYRGAPAVYIITPTGNGIYEAHLVDYKGCADYDPPPAKVVFFKGATKWIGSVEEAELLYGLGSEVEAIFSASDFLSFDRYPLEQNKRSSGSSPEAAPNRS